MSSKPVPECNVTFIGNATVLLRLGPFTVLTDPNFLEAGQRAYLGYGLWSKRLKDPAMSVGQLPNLDAVVLSHLHGDHWDAVAERGLDRSVPVFTTGQAARTLGRRGFATAGLESWQSVDLNADGTRLTVTAMPGKHGPGLLNRLLPPVMGSMVDLTVDGARVLRLYISGDTLNTSELGEIALRYPDIDAALVHLGGTKLLKVFLVTMDGRQGTELMEMLKPHRVMPIHHDDYTVFSSPVSDFERQMRARGLPSTVVVLRRGDTKTLIGEGWS